MDDPDSNIHKAAAEALGKIGDTAALESLLKVLKDESSDVRSAAAEALGKLKDKSSLPDLLEHLRDDPIANVRASAAHAVGQIGDPAAAPDLLDALKKNKSWDVRREIVLALGKIGDPSAITELRGILHNEHNGDNSGLRMYEHNEIRCVAGMALIWLKDEASISPLIELLNQGLHFIHDDFTSSVVRALGETEKLGAPRLISLLNSPQGGSDLQAAAADTLKSIGSKEALDGVRKWEYQL